MPGKNEIRQERSVGKRDMDQREAMIAAIRAQVEKEKAEKEEKLKKEQGITGNTSAGTGSEGGKPQFKTLSAEDLQKLEEKKRRKQAGEPEPLGAETPAAGAPKEQPVSSAGLGGLGGGLDQQAGATLGNVATEGGSLMGGAASGDSLAGGLGGSGAGEGLGISGLGAPVTSIQEDSFSSASQAGQGSGWEAAAPTAEAAAAPKQNVDDDGNLISVVPIKQSGAGEQDVKSLYNIDFDDDDSAEGTSSPETPAEPPQQEKAPEIDEAEKEAARQAAIEATKRAEEEAKRAAERAAKRSAEDETIKRAKEEAAKRREAEQAKRKAAEDAARSKYADELQSKANTTNRRLDAAAQKVIAANNKVADLDDQDKNHTKYVDEALAKIDAETENKIAKVKAAEADRVKAVADTYADKRAALVADFEAKEEEAKKRVADEKAAKTAGLDQIKLSQKDKKDALGVENGNQKAALQQEEIDRKDALTQSEQQDKAALEESNGKDRQRLEESLKQDARAAEDALASAKTQIAEADSRIQAAIDHVAEIERQLEEAKKAVELEKQNKIEAESGIADKEQAVAVQKQQADAKRSEFETACRDKLQKLETDYVGKREALVNEYVQKQNQLVEDYNSRCAALDAETESLLAQAEQEIAGIDVKEEADKLNRAAGLEERKNALADEEKQEAAKAKEQTQSEIDACRQQGETEKNAYLTKANDEVDAIRIQLKEARDEAASLMQVYEITKRNALETMDSAKRAGIAVSMPALDIEIPAGAVAAAYQKSPKQAVKSEASASGQNVAAASSDIPASVMEYMEKYMQAPAIAASVKTVLTQIVTNPAGNKNILVLGKHGFGSTIVGNDFARAFYAAGMCSSKTIANIKSASLNKRPVASVKDKLKGGCLVVENAGTLTTERLQEIAEITRDASNDITVILTGEQERTNYVINDAGIADVFGHTILMTAVDDEGMFSIGKAYVKQLGYTMDSSAESTLKNKLKEIEDGNLDRYLKLIDDAVEKAKKQGETGHLASVDFS